jgi:hypothetical protein
MSPIATKGVLTSGTEERKTDYLGYIAPVVELEDKTLGVFRVDRNTD